MARIRTIKPDFWDDEKLSILPLQARLVFIGTWNLSDDFGIVKSNPAWIRSRLFPYDESIRTQDVLKWLNALQEARMLIPLQYKGESYYKIRTFEAHQVINRPGERTIPKDEEAELIGVSEDSLNDHGMLTEDSLNDHGMLTEDSLNDHGMLTAGKEGKGKEGKGKESIPIPENLSGFPEFLKAWDEWRKFRSSIRKPLSPISEAQQLKMLAEMGPEEAVRSISNSIRNGYQGLFPPKNGPGKKVSNMAENMRIMQEMCDEQGQNHDSP